MSNNKLEVVLKTTIAEPLLRGLDGKACICVTMHSLSEFAKSVQTIPILVWKDLSLSLKDPLNTRDI